MTDADFKEKATQIARLINSDVAFAKGLDREGLIASEIERALADVDAKARAEALAGTEDNPFEPGTWGEEVWQKGRNAGYEQGVWEVAKVVWRYVDEPSFTRVQSDILDLLEPKEAKHGD